MDIELELKTTSSDTMNEKNQTTKILFDLLSLPFPIIMGV